VKKVKQPLNICLRATNKKAKEAVERGMVWTKFRAGEKKRNGTWAGMKKGNVTEPMLTEAARKKLQGLAFGDATPPDRAVTLVYGGVKILKRDLKNRSP
jgi:hypothetical protein